MKFIIAILAVVLLGVHVVALLGLADLTPFLVSVISLFIGGVVVLLALSLRTNAEGASNASAPPPAAPAAKGGEPVRAEAEIVAFLALLQSEGRLVDFAQELIDDASDEQVGAAARVVHAGVRKVLRQYLELGPVRAEQEGATIVLKGGFDPALYRLVGKVADQPPYKGRLLHPGWAVNKVRLPRVTAVSKDYPWPVLAPAEIEVQPGD